VEVDLERPVPPGGTTVVELAYQGAIGDYVGTGMRYIQDRIDPAFTILRRDAFAYPVPGPPSRAGLREAGLPRFEWSARIEVPATHRVACGGELLEQVSRDDRVTYCFKSHRPSWRMDFAVARYEIQQRADRRVYHFPRDHEGALRVMDALETAFELYSTWFGPLPDPAPFTVIEIPDGWGSQADACSILQTASAFQDPTRLVELYHEVSHLFNAPSRDAHPPRWEEGLAMFLQYRVADHLEGTDRKRDALKRVADDIRRRMQQDPRLLRTPMSRYGEENLTDLSYSVGMLMFEALWKHIGPKKFDRILADFLSEFRNTGATTKEFARHASAAAGETLALFFETWLFTTAWCEQFTALNP